MGAAGGTAAEGVGETAGGVDHRTGAAVEATL